MEKTGTAINYLTKDFLIEANITHILEDEECPDKRFAGKIHNHDSLEGKDTIKKTPLILE